MTQCKHTTIVLLPEEKKRLRCRHCQLTLKEDDVSGGYCPECFEVSGSKRYDFDAVTVNIAGKARYRCEECGVLIG